MLSYTVTYISDYYSTVVSIHYPLKYFQTSHTQRMERELQVVIFMSPDQKFKCVNYVATRHRIKEINMSVTVNEIHGFYLFSHVFLLLLCVSFHHT
jgi:hypothetical protein